MQEDSPLARNLNDEPSEAPAPAVIEAPATEAADTRPRDEHGRFAPKGEESASPAPAENQEEAPFEHAAVKGERTRRQEAERQVQERDARLAALEQQLQQLQKPNDPPAPPPSIWDDEQGWQQHQQRLILSQADQLSRINASEMAARSAHADFQEMFDLFNTMATQNPAVVQQAMADPHPWNKAYQLAKSHKTMTELGAVDVADLEAKIEARVREEMMGQSPVPQPALPPSLSAERNVGARSGPAWAGFKTLEERLR